MELKIVLSDRDSEILAHIVSALNEPGLTAEKYATDILTGVLARIWADLCDDEQVMN